MKESNRSSHQRSSPHRSSPQSKLRNDPPSKEQTLNIKVASPRFDSEHGNEEAHSNSYDVEEFDLVQPQVIGATVVSSKVKGQLTDINDYSDPMLIDENNKGNRDYNQE